MVSENASIALGLVRAEALLRRRLEGPLAASHGIGLTEFAILAELEAVRGNRLRSVDLAQRLVLTPSGITRATRPLLQRGLLERIADDRDARGSYVSLTPLGRRCFEASLPTLEHAAAQAFAGTMARSDRLAVLGLLERLPF